MNIQQQAPSTRPAFITTLVVSWLTIRGLLWIAEALFFQETGYTWHSSLIDGLLGLFCISLAVQFWIGISGIRLPVVIMLLMHFGIHLYRWAILDPSGWWTISTMQRLQVIFEASVSMVLVGLLILMPRLHVVQSAQE